jgi:hypothetical protein
MSSHVPPHAEEALARQTPSGGRRGDAASRDIDQVSSKTGHDGRRQVAAFAGAPTAAATRGPNVTVASDSNAAIGAASNPPNAKARHQSLCTHFVRDALAYRFINLKHVATDRQFADVFTKAPTAPMLMLLKTLMEGTAAVPLLARLYQ